MEILVGRRRFSRGRINDGGFMMGLMIVGDGGNRGSLNLPQTMIETSSANGENN